MSKTILFLGVALGFLVSGWAAAQDAVQVLVKPDGGIKVINPRTGKELPSVVTRSPGVVIRAIAVQDADDVRIELWQEKDPRETQTAALERARKALHALHRKLGATPDLLQVEFQIDPAGGDGSKIVVIEKAA